MKKLFCLILLCIFSIPLLAQQDYMMVYKPGKKKRYYYFIGDHIKVRPVRNFPMREGTIYALSDSALYFSQVDSILYSEIDYVQIRERAGLFSSQFLVYNTTSVVGSLLIMEAAYLVNTGKNSPYLKQGGIIVAAVTGIPLAIQGITALVRKTRVYIRPEEYRIGIVQMPKPSQ